MEGLQRVHDAQKETVRSSAFGRVACRRAGTSTAATRVCHQTKHAQVGRHKPPPYRLGLPFTILKSRVWRRPWTNLFPFVTNFRASRQTCPKQRSEPIDRGHFRPYCHRKDWVYGERRNAQRTSKRGTKIINLPERRNPLDMERGTKRGQPFYPSFRFCLQFSWICRDLYYVYNAAASSLNVSRGFPGVN